jgi:hypothetical protein
MLFRNVFLKIILQNTQNYNNLELIQLAQIVHYLQKIINSLKFA